MNSTTERGKSATFYARVQNDATSDDFTLQGPTGGAGFKVKYSIGGTHITGPVTGGGYSLTSVDSGDLSPKVKIKVKVKSSAGLGATQSVLLTAISSVDPLARDAVKAKVSAE